MTWDWTTGNRLIGLGQSSVSGNLMNGMGWSLDKDPVEMRHRMDLVLFRLSQGPSKLPS